MGQAEGMEYHAESLRIRMIGPHPRVRSVRSTLSRVYAGEGKAEQSESRG